MSKEKTYIVSTLICDNDGNFLIGKYDGNSEDWNLSTVVLMLKDKDEDCTDKIKEIAFSDLGVKIELSKHSKMMDYDVDESGIVLNMQVLIASIVEDNSKPVSDFKIKFVKASELEEYTFVKYDRHIAKAILDAHNAIKKFEKIVEDFNEKVDSYAESDSSKAIVSLNYYDIEKTAEMINKRKDEFVVFVEGAYDGTRHNDLQLSLDDAERVAIEMLQKVREIREYMDTHSKPTNIETLQNEYVMMKRENMGNLTGLELEFFEKLVNKINKEGEK